MLFCLTKYIKNVRISWSKGGVMSKLNIINVNLETAYDVIRENIYSCVVTPRIVEDTKFHHQINIEKVPTAINYGLLSKENYERRVNNRELTEREKYIFSDECYVNGINCISLSTMDLDFSLINPRELFWDSYGSINPDIIVSSDINMRRNSKNYFNEYLVENEIPTNMFNSIDFRILRILKNEKLEIKFNTREEKIKFLIDYYNYIKEIACLLKQKELDIPLREVSEIHNLSEDDKALTLGIDEVIDMPKLILK